MTRRLLILAVVLYLGALAASLSTLPDPLPACGQTVDCI